MSLNVYANLDELKAALDIEGTTYDELLLAALVRASRLIDDAAGRRFYPLSATRYEDGNGCEELWLSESWLELTTISISDDAETYTAMSASDWWASDGKTWDRPPYQFIVINPNGSYGEWYAERRAVKIVGVLGWHRDYSNAWETSGDTITDAAGISSSATTITVANVNALNARGTSPRFSVGSLLKIESEYCEVTRINSTTNKLTVVRAVNGTTAATHALSTAISVYRPEEPASHATIIQAGRLFKRGQQAFADAGANFELGQLNYVKGLDPEAQAILYTAGLRRLSIG